jgi:hypothetical protein
VVSGEVVSQMPLVMPCGRRPAAMVVRLGQFDQQAPRRLQVGSAEALGKQPWISPSNRRASSSLSCCCHRRLRLTAARNSNEFACWRRATPRTCRKHASASGACLWSPDGRVWPLAWSKRSRSSADTAQTHLYGCLMVAYVVGYRPMPRRPCPAPLRPPGVSTGRQQA